MPNDHRRIHILIDSEVSTKADKMASAVGLRRGRLCSRSELIIHLIRTAKPSQVAEEMAKEDAK